MVRRSGVARANIIRSLIRRGWPMLATALATSALPGLGQAADTSATADGGSAELSEVVVTGSLIRNANYVSSSPIVTTSAEELQATGAVTVEAALTQLPDFAPSTTANSAGPSVINLHALGSNRNLVLLDGRRLPLSDISGNVDTNLIPDAILSSVDVITGGASAVYGSDAMSGVVNFLTIRHFDGIRADVQYGNSAKGDAARTAASVAFGSTIGEGRGHIVFSVSYTDRQALKGAKRSFFDLVTPSSFIGQGTFVPAANNLPNQTALNTLFTGYGQTTPVSNALNLGFNDDGTLFTQTGAKNYKGPTTDGYAVIAGNVRMPVGPQGYITSPLDRKSLFTKFDYQLAPGITAYGQVLYVRTNITGDTSKSLTQIGTLTTIPVTNPFIPSDLRTLLASRPTPTAAFTWNGRYVGVPGKALEEQRNTVQLLGGLRGSLPFRNWTWDVFIGYDETQRNEQIHNAVLKSQVQNLLNASDGGNALCAGGFNPFGLNHSINISQACLNYMTATAQSSERLAQTQMQGVVQGSLLTLPAGDLTLAVLAGSRRNDYSYLPDANLAAGNIEAIGGGAPSFGHIKVDEYATQIDVPLLKDKAFARDLSLGAAYRSSRYSTSGNVVSYEADLKWRPIDNVLVRGGYQRAVRAPNIGELFQSPSNNQVAVNTPPQATGDPCDIRSIARTGSTGAGVRALCLAQGVPASIIDTYTFATTATGGLLSGNPSLTPETANTSNYGLVWTPAWSNAHVSDISLSADYFNINIKNVISVVPGTTALAKCYNLDGSNPTYSVTNPFCALLSRDANGQLTQVRTPYFNLAGLKTDGIDLQFAVAFPVGTGKIHFDTAVGYTAHYLQQTLPGTPFQDFIHTETNTTNGSHPTYKALTSIGYSRGGANVALHWRYLGAMNDVTFVTTPASPSPGVGTYNMYDLTGTYKVSDSWVLRAGITNLLDKGSPIVSSSQNATDLSVYDSVGRSFYLGVRYSK
jgi:outer membrane receptor protein involved in Fe transport